MCKSMETVMDDWSGAFAFGNSANLIEGWEKLLIWQL